MNNFNVKFTNLETLLMISSNNNTEIIDAMSLGIYDYNQISSLQTDFWHHQHHWNIEYSVENFIGLIYSVRYMSNEYEITPVTRRYFNKSFNDTSRFANVTNLTLCLQALTNSDAHHFQNVKKKVYGF
jgi:hypothetical protein